MNNQYEVLSPWADIDPISLKGISPRVLELTGKKIGLFCNYKRAAKPILDEVEKELKQRFPTCETVWLTQRQFVPITEMKGEEKANFEGWLKEVDSVIAAVGD